MRFRNPAGCRLPGYFFFFAGTFAPEALASLSAMAMACFGFFTFGPFLEPECRSPCLNSCITFPAFF